jgi:hypothetical protein
MTITTDRFGLPSLNRRSAVVHSKPVEPFSGKVTEIMTRTLGGPHYIVWNNGRGAGGLRTLPGSANFGINNVSAACGLCRSK